MITTDRLAESFAPESKTCESVNPGRKLSCSLTVGWSSLLVQTFECSANLEPFETLASPDQLIVLVIKGECEIESFSSRSWKRGFYRPGLGGMTAGGNTSRLRCRSKVSDVSGTLHIYIPQFFLSDATDEYRRAGIPSRQEQPDTLVFCDPVVSQVALSLAEAIKVGAPNLYAETTARFLATHLLSTHSRWAEPYPGVRRPGALSDRRLKRVLEFMEHHFMDSLSLGQLAEEAGISRFHFVRLFKEGFGVTPHRHLVRLRMKAAAEMLSNTDLSVQEVASKCGYVSATHFSAAFQKHFSRTPSGFRTKLYAADVDPR